MIDKRGVMIMEVAKKPQTQDLNLINILDVVCQEFDGVSFYGLEYIVEELFQTKQRSPRVSSSEDWLDYYD